MKSVVVAQQKGGVGKTAFSLHLAWYFSQKKNKKVLFIDLDTQCNASYTLSVGKNPAYILNESGDLFSKEISVNIDEFNSETLVLSKGSNSLADVQKLDLAKAAEIFIKNLEYLKRLNYFDYCIIDTPPSLSNTLACALLGSDHVICPIELEMYSMQGISKMVDTILNLAHSNTNLNFLGLLPSKVDRRNPRHVRHLEQINIHYSKYLIPCVIGLRSSIANAVENGIPVWNDKKTAARKASQEIIQSAEYIFEKLNVEV